MRENAEGAESGRQTKPAWHGQAASQVRRSCCCGRRVWRVVAPILGKESASHSRACEEERERKRESRKQLGQVFSRLASRKWPARSSGGQRETKEVIDPPEARGCQGNMTKSISIGDRKLSRQTPHLSSYFVRTSFHHLSLICTGHISDLNDMFVNFL